MLMKRVAYNGEVERLVECKNRERGQEGQTEGDSESPWLRASEWVSECIIESDLPILLFGETGTGKTSIAKWIHERRFGTHRPWAEVNLATLHGGTLEAELFGFEKGAFTGAFTQKIGKLESANGGTVFLDEITDLPMDLQARLLLFLDSKVIYRMGSNIPRKLNVKIVAATQKDLQDLVNKGQFRADLYFRLKGAEVKLPPLRERGTDFGEYLHHILNEICRELNRTVLSIEENLACQMERYDWPGNYRELKQALRFAVLNSPGKELKLGAMPEWFKNWVNHSYSNGPHSYEKLTTDSGSVLDAIANQILAILEDGKNQNLRMNVTELLKNLEQLVIVKALEKHGWKFRNGARFLGYSKSTLHRRWSGGVFCGGRGDQI